MAGDGGSGMRYGVCGLLLQHDSELADHRVVDVTPQAQQQAAQAQQVAAAKAAELQDAARAKAAELYTQVCCRGSPRGSPPRYFVAKRPGCCFVAELDLSLRLLQACVVALPCSGTI